MRRDQLDPSLVTALGMTAYAALPAVEPWWIIGNAAVALHGVTLPVANVDLLLAPSDATRVLQQMETPVTRDGGQGRFRSEVFGRWRGSVIPIDVLGGFQVLHKGCWIEVRPMTREAV